MARGKAINVKVATSKVIKALQDSLDKLTKQFEAEQKAEKAYEKEMEDYRKKILDLAIKQIAKAENMRINTRYNGLVNVDFDLPAGTIKVPTEPERVTINLPVWTYNEQKEEIENAIRILKMTDEETVSTSTYQAVARYL